MKKQMCFRGTYFAEGRGDWFGNILSPPEREILATCVKI